MPDALSPAEVALLARAALVFEDALDALVPTARRGTSAPYWCQSSRASPALRGDSLAHALDKVERAGALAVACNEHRPVVEVMNLVPAASAYGRAHGKTRDFIRGKVYKWDFEGMLPGGRQTVEFRLPPGCTVAEEARGWVELAAAFVAGVIRAGPVDGSGYENRATLEELWEMLLAGAAALGWQDTTGLEGIFARRE